MYAEDATWFASALAALSTRLVISAHGGPAEHSLAALLGTVPCAAVETASSSVTGSTVAKILFTSGSTGAPKGVITAHGMLCANQQMVRQVWPFLIQERPVLLDWLPWSHAFGGSHNVNLILASGGTLYVDDGRPAPDLFPRTLANMCDVSPTLAFNVPAGFAQLVPALENDRDLAARFFSRLRLIFNAAAALPRLCAHDSRHSATRSPGETCPSPARGAPPKRHPLLPARTTRSSTRAASASRFPE